MIEGTAQTGKRTSYPAYKDSGVEWLGEMPAHWELKRLKFSASINDEALPETTDPDMHLSYVDIGSVHPIHGITSTAEMAFEDAPSRARRIVRDGDTIISTVRTYLRAIAAIRNSVPNTIVSTGFAVVRPRSVSPSFISYVLSEQGFIEAIMARSVGVSYPAINASEIGMLSIPLPPLSEQRAIAAFLDRETEKIDTLVAKKRTLIERLKEERTALITHTVTRGLPPEAARAAGLEPHPKLKPSSVEWLGDMPKHWSSKRLKTISRIRYGLGQPPRELSGGVPLIRATNVIRGRITEKDMVYIDPEDVPKGRDAFLAEKEIIVVRSGAYTADSAIIPRAYDGAVTGYDMVVTVNDALAEFVALALLCTYVRDGQLIISSMRAAQPHLNAEELGATVLLLPPLSEQRAIADFLDGETEKIDTLVEKIGAAIERLQEYRFALITAAVTGKIDVRKEDAL